MTNLITPMQDALGDGVPVVFIRAQVARTAMGTDAFQECDATRVSGGATKWNYVCLDPSRLPWAINECFRKATTGRPGPVVDQLAHEVDLLPLGSALDESFLEGYRSGLKAGYLKSANPSGIDLRARAPTSPVQGLWWRIDLRAQAPTSPMQVLRW